MTDRDRKIAMMFEPEPTKPRGYGEKWPEWWIQSVNGWEPHLDYMHLLKWLLERQEEVRVHVRHCDSCDGKSVYWADYEGLELPQEADTLESAIAEAVLREERESCMNCGSCAEECDCQFPRFDDGGY